MAKKAGSKKTGKTKKELLDAAIAEAVGAGKELHLESVDFSDPNRPKTCLEVDFPILHINTIAEIEGKGSGALKPIYQVMKWWARRRSTVFRQLLVSAVVKAPDEPTEAARFAWSAYYRNHQSNSLFRRLKVADIFMGGGTTVVEGSRLGMQMFGNDLNPVAWFVVRNALADVDHKEVEKLLDYVESQVKPQIMPFYTCDCPRGHKGEWKQRSTGKAMSKSFDPLSLKPEERADYDYDGPQVIYTFWAKHGPCQSTECNHRTPILTSPVFATKTLTIPAWRDRKCRGCGKTFDIEPHDARLAPGSLYIISPTEEPFCVMSESGDYRCPHCDLHFNNEAAKWNKSSSSLGSCQTKSITLNLLVHPEWIAGQAGQIDSSPLGGSVVDDAGDTAKWNNDRGNTLRLIEIRGPLPDEVTCPDSDQVLYTGSKGGTVPKRSTFTCKESTCGLDQDLLSSVRRYGRPAPIAAYAIQGICPTCEKEKRPLDGKFFSTPNVRQANAAVFEWQERRTKDLAEFWPQSKIEIGDEIGEHDVNGHHFSHWWKMFNHRQLLVHALLLKTIATASVAWEVKEQVLGVFQQYLRNQNLFCFWNTQRALEPLFSDNHFHPKSTAIENSVFSGKARGDFSSCAAKLVESLAWSRDPWEIASPDGGHSQKVKTRDPLVRKVTLECGSASSLDSIADKSLDLIVTDPPFGGLIQYAELSDFFYVWLRLVLKDRYPKEFRNEYTPKLLEAVSNGSRHEGQADKFYQKVLTQCWSEANRMLKDGGLLVFTFHHSEDAPWIAVLESLFDAGFYLEGAFPIRSDETKGDGQFGSQKIEFDIVHVCRKRIETPEEISWARLRRQILSDVRQLQEILEHHQEAGLQEADLQVIRRGKALEYFSKHYGKVYVEKGREFTVKEALAGINQLLDDQRDSSAEVPPVDAEPYTRQFLRLFTDATSLPRDQIQKYLRGTGVSPAEFEERGWCSEEKKVFHFTSPLALAQKWKGVSRQGMGRDFDQAMFLIGACYENSGIRVQDTLNNDKFIPHPATGDIIDWFTRHGGDSQMKAAARLAKQLYTKWVAANEPKVKAAQRTFDFADEEA